MAGDKKGAIERQGTLIFADESGFSLLPLVMRTWAPVGRTPVLVHRFNWKRLSAMGAILIGPGRLEFLLGLVPGTITQVQVCQFVDQVGREVAGEAVLLWDGLASHRSTLTKAKIAEHSGWLRVHRLPAYAPELNPQEYVWSSMKGKDLAGFCPDTLAQVAEAAVKAAQRIGTDADLLAGCLVASGLFTMEEIVTITGKDH